MLLLSEDEKSEETVSGNEKKPRLHIATGHPAEQILHYADGHGIDHIVVGHRGKKQFSQWLLGSVARQVVDHAPCPVTVTRK
ncbi:TPA: universal stress protein [Klebsiella pneumoniae]